MRFRNLPQGSALCLFALASVATARPLPGPTFGSNAPDPSQRPDHYANMNSGALGSTLDEHGLFTATPSARYISAFNNQDWDLPQDHVDGFVGSEAWNHADNIDSLAAWETSQHHLDNPHSTAAFDDSPLQNMPFHGPSTADQSHPSDSPNIFGTLDQLQYPYSGVDHEVQGQKAWRSQRPAVPSRPPADRDGSMYSSLEDLVGNVMQPQQSPDHRFPATDDRGKLLLGDAVQDGIEPFPFPRSVTQSGMLVSENKFLTKAMADKFPVSVRGIVHAGRPGFKRGGNRANHFETRNSVEWQKYMSSAYFNDLLEWISMSKAETLKARTILRKNKAQYVLPSATDGMPSVRIHRHFMLNRSIEGLTHASSIRSGSSIISVWSGPHRDSSTGGADTKERYTTFFHGLGQISLENHLPVIEHLEQLIAKRPPAEYVKF